MGKYRSEKLQIRTLFTQCFFSKYEQVRRKLLIYSHVLKKLLNGKFIFYAVINCYYSVIFGVVVMWLFGVVVYCGYVVIWCSGYAPWRSGYVAPWCSGYHYYTTSFNKAWTQVLRRFKPCSRRVRDSRWSGSLTTVPAGNKATHLLSVNHTTKTIHHHHHHPLQMFSSEFYEILQNKLFYYNTSRLLLTFF